MSGHAACQRRWRDACLNMSCPSSHGVLGFLLLSSRSHPQRIAWTLRETLQSVPLSLVKPSHQALNPFATLLWSMSRPQTLLNPLSPVQLIRHAPITKASSNYVGMSMWMPFLWHLSHQCVCSKSGSTCATLQVMLSTGNPCLCFCGRPTPPTKKKRHLSSISFWLRLLSTNPFQIIATSVSTNTVVNLSYSVYLDPNSKRISTTNNQHILSFDPNTKIDDNTDILDDIQ